MLLPLAAFALIPAASADAPATAAEALTPYTAGELAPGVHLLSTPLDYLGAITGNVTIIEQSDGMAVIESGQTGGDDRRPGRANTDGDALAWLPNERIVVTGDVVVHPVPFGFFSFPGEWIAVLERLKGLNPAWLVPGHGEP